MLRYLAPSLVSSIVSSSSCHHLPRNLCLVPSHILTCQLPPRRRHLHTSPPLPMDLTSVVRALEDIAPTRAAEPWDNVGLLLEPTSPQPIERLVITNDLTEQVLEEILGKEGKRTGLVVSYHPPLFKPLKRLTQAASKEKILIRALEEGIAVYSPHTALDNMEGGINDWLLEGVGGGEVTALGLQKHPHPLTNVLELQGFTEEERLKKLAEEFSGECQVNTSTSGIVVECTDRSLAAIIPKLKREFSSHTLSIQSNIKVAPTLSGGKFLTLPPTPLSEIVKRVKAHLQLNHIRLATPYQQGEDPVIKTAAACAGSGGSVLDGVKADLLLTGEMSHHQVLAATDRGASVILCDHSNTERGFLQGVYRKRLEEAFDGLVEVSIAATDRDPLKIV